MQVVSKTVFVQGRDSKLNVTVYPRSNSDTIILLHGGPGVPDEMTEVREWFSDFMQVINFDQRGSGRSISASFGLDEYVADLAAIADYFRLEKLHLFGHSWGGIYAQLFAKLFPDRILSIFLCSPAPGMGRIWKKAEREIFFYNFRRSTWPERMGMAINTCLGMMGNTKAYRKLFRQLIINYHKGYNVDPPDDDKLSLIGAEAGTRTRREIKRHPGISPFGYTTYPVIITYGDSDVFRKSRNFLFKLFPEARKEIIPSCGHTPWKHNLPAFQKVLSSFYNK